MPKATALRLVGVFLAIIGVTLSGTSLSAPQPPHISETDVPPQSRPLTHAQLLEEYLTKLHDRLRFETRAVQQGGLVEVKLTVRQDGSVTFCEIVVLDGPATLRADLLPLINQLGPLAPPPVDADMLDVSLLLATGYPGPDLLDSIGQER
jgi:hypothetical protein